ncbi:MAG TPA: hypothetical protein VHZ51_26540, partial [Ktedonobacteraceae bacterium]|nr:hypothetical protein [Ktedonobacteraceae bacterium]
MHTHHLALARVFWINVFSCLCKNRPGDSSNVAEDFVVFSLLFYKKAIRTNVDWSSMLLGKLTRH